MHHWVWVSILACSLSLYLRIKKSDVRYPPGPRGLPIVGNIFQLESKKPWHTFASWKDIYGPLVYMKIFGQSVVVINTQQAARDLLERRSSKYSSRPPLIVRNKITGNQDIAALPLNDRWRKMRRASDSALNSKVARDYEYVQRLESVLLAHGIFNEPFAWRSHLERTSSSMTLSMVYALPPLQTLHHPTVLFMNRVVDSIAESTMPGAYMVEILPSLQYLPRFFNGWRSRAEANFKNFDSTFRDMFLKIKNEFVNGQEQSQSFSLKFAEGQANHKMSDQECAWLAGILYSAGHETTTTTMCWFILSMVLYPKYQIEAQKELDKVVGYARLPSFSDLPHLPYIQAILKEVLRWRPAAPLAAPHVSTEDDFYDGYFIPKGSMVIPNVWTMNRDPEIYGSDGDRFNPERHLDDNKMLKSDINEGHFTYGFGQRVCVGRHVANNSLFIQIAIILWAMSLEPAKDSSGNPIRPNVHAEEQNGIFIRPAPFDIIARARFSEAEALIQQTREDIMKEVNSQFELTRDT